jgi:hypothetical protein
VRWTREAIVARVEALRGEHDGPALVGAVREFGEQLDDDERAVLGDVLLEQARRERPSLARVRREGWFRRQLRKLDER